MQTRNRQGEISEAAFFLRCTQMGWVACRPGVEKQHYDYIVDTGKTLVRAQVKSTAVPCSRYRYHVNLGRGEKSKMAYTKEEIDCFAVHIPPDDIWYILSVEDAAGRVGMSVPMKGHQRGTPCEKYYEAWDMMQRLSMMDNREESRNSKSETQSRAPRKKWPGFAPPHPAPRPEEPPRLRLLPGREAAPPPPVASVKRPSSGVGVPKGASHKPRATSAL